MIGNAFGVVLWIGIPILLVALLVESWLHHRHKG